MKGRILTIGNAYIEMHMQTARLPIANQTVVEDDYELRPGGKGGNSAVAVARMGLESVFCASVGQDNDGNRLRNFYNFNSINTSTMYVDPAHPTGLSVYLYEKQYDSRRRIIYPGANKSFSISQIEAALGTYPDAIFMTLEVPFTLAIAVTALAKDHGIPVFLDASPAQLGVKLDQLENIEIFFASKQEVYIHTGINPTSLESCLKACIALGQTVKAKYYVLRLGESGFFVYDGKFHNVLGPYNLDNAPSPTFVDVEAAIVSSEYLITQDIRKACLVGSAASKMAKERHDIKIPTREQLREFCTENGYDIKIARV